MKKIFIIILSIIFCFIPSSCDLNAETKITETEFFAMDTEMYLGAYGKNANEALRQAKDYIYRLDELLSYQNDKSEIYKLNNKSGLSVELSKDTIDILNEAKFYASKTDGCFEPTIAPLSKLWNINSKQTVIPEKTEIEKALKLINYKNIEISGLNADLKKSGMSVDLGGIAKGYASDKIFDIFKNKNIKSAIISLGGNVAALGAKPDNSSWKIGLRDIDGTDNDYFGIISVKNKFVITSGDYERFFIKDGVRYHHILDPKTGYPVNNGLRSVTIISANGTLGDAYSTALFVMGLDKALQFQKSEKSFEAVFVTKDKRVICTDGIKASFEFTGSAKGYKFEKQ